MERVWLGAWHKPMGRHLGQHRQWTGLLLNTEKQKNSITYAFWFEFHQIHSSLLRTFGFSATSTYNSYLPLIFEKFALIWGHFQNIWVCRFWGHWGCRGQTTSKSKTTKILNENLLKLDEIQNLASATSKMTSWPQRPRKGLSGFFQKLHF